MLTVRRINCKYFVMYMFGSMHTYTISLTSSGIRVTA